MKILFENLSNMKKKKFFKLFPPLVFARKNFETTYFVFFFWSTPLTYSLLPNHSFQISRNSSPLCTLCHLQPSTHSFSIVLPFNFKEIIFSVSSPNPCPPNLFRIFRLLFSWYSLTHRQLPFPNCNLYHHFVHPKR